MKRILSISIIVLLFATACNNQPKPAETAATAAFTPPAPALLPAYTGRFIELTVNDFDTWHGMFKARDSFFRANGLTDPGVGRELENDKKVVIFSTVTDMAKAQAYDVSPERKESMAKAGITDATTPSYWNVIMDDTSSIPQMPRVMVVHHVKDFDTWKKAFDAEGKTARLADGIYDRAMARGIPDSNSVVLIFAITDTAKAKARMASPELKKIMTDAGVDSAPQFTWFKWVNM